MIDQSRITSGFDLELLLSERYIKYFLLASFETGSMPWYMQDIDPNTGDITHIMIHPPVELQERFRKERERFLKFDLEPFEFADLQSKKLLVLEFEGSQIIHMRKSAGGAVYYRDRPDPDKGDNLLKLPHYKSEPIVRA
jgi:hypothetical protein